MKNMDILQATKCEDLIKIGGGNGHVYIYGAKTIAQRACLFLEHHGITVEAFLVSKAYENPETVEGHPVWRIEEHAADDFDVVIIAVSGAGPTRGVLKELGRYHVKTVAVILPSLADAFPQEAILTDRCRIAPGVFLANDVEIFADETSEIVIEEGAFLSSRVVILASNHSRVHIGKRVMLGECVHIVVTSSSPVKLGESVIIGDCAHIVATMSSCVELGDDVRLDAWGDIEVLQGVVCLGAGTTVESHALLAAARSGIFFGKDNMLSHHVMIMNGYHEVLDAKTGKPRTNRQPVRTDDHVWIGLRATLLPGVEIGEGSIVGAASVVTRKFPPHCTIAGNPARVLREGILWQR